MNEENAPKPLFSGVIYGEFAFWLAVIGSAIAIIGMMIYFSGNQFFDAQGLLSGLWSGQTAEEIWRNASATKEVIHGHWYLDYLTTSDGIAMLGIGVSCLAGVLGAWGSFLVMVTKKDNPTVFMVFAGLISLLLTASAFGLITMH